jgi:hypothetical protein
MSNTESSFVPIAAATGHPIRLAMQRLWLTGRVLPAGARLVVQHVFRSEEERPLEVIYSFPLPRDAALRAFRIVGEGFEVHSELKETEEALKSMKLELRMAQCRRWLGSMAMESSISPWAYPTEGNGNCLSRNARGSRATR